MELLSDSTVRLVTWNVNGIRSLYKSTSEIKQGLDALEADVICFQETKLSRDALEESLAIVEGYNSYYGFPRNKSGYSGVATYCRNNFSPFKAEEGLSGIFSKEAKDNVGCYCNINSKFSKAQLREIDSEGRAIITQHKFTVPSSQEEKFLAVINVYCPRADPDNKERLQMKLMFYELLETRAQALLESGSHVMIVGDINTSHKPIDHCNPEDVEHFNANPCRLWLNHIILDPDNENCKNMRGEDANLQMIDAFRYLHPTAQNAFTCWSTQLNARATNYGTRIDYILIDDGLKVRVMDCNILKDVTGSDHCPVRIVMNINGLHAPNLPSICTKFYPELLGTQKKLLDFYKKAETGITTIQHKEKHKNNNPISEQKHKLSTINKNPKRQKGIEGFLIKSTTVIEKISASDSVVDYHSPESATSYSYPEDASILKGTASSKSSISSEALFENEDMDADLSRNLPSTSCCTASVSYLEKDPIMMGKRTEKHVPLKPSAAETWKKMFSGPKPIPKCKGHNEPCVRRCVKKKGPNFNRKFWVCARGEGHYNDPLARCDFFLWDA